MSEGVIYVLINEAMPGYVKIGKTSTSVEQRMKELDTSGIPLPFECYYAAKVPDVHRAELLLHDAFDDHRTRKRREFFQVSPERVTSALKLAATEEVTPRSDVVEDADDQSALDKARQRRSIFNFKMVGIEPGSVLSFVKDHEETCSVLDERRISFRGNETSLSAAALELVHELGYEWKTLAGTEFWEFDGETLNERRMRMEEGTD